MIQPGEISFLLKLDNGASETVWLSRASTLTIELSQSETSLATVKSGHTLWAVGATYCCLLEKLMEQRRCSASRNLNYPYQYPQQVHKLRKLRPSRVRSTREVGKLNPKLWEKDWLLRSGALEVWSCGWRGDGATLHLEACESGGFGC